MQTFVTPRGLSQWFVNKWLNGTTEIQNPMVACQSNQCDANFRVSLQILNITFKSLQSYKLHGARLAVNTGIL